MYNTKPLVSVRENFPGAGYATIMLESNNGGATMFFESAEKLQEFALSILHQLNGGEE
jgi:hypothetical protein